MGFNDELLKVQRTVNDNILKFLPPAEGFQHTVLEAADYSVINGGKRLRPIMMQCSYMLCRGIEDFSLPASDGDILFPFMAAMEMMHSSSLVHDDLPCMDNDVLRRGVPSTWARYGEDMGTLAGDALMIYAFETACRSGADGEKKSRAIEILASKSGIYGMVGGQTVDVELTGRTPSPEQLEFIYRLKTGALIEASFMIGAVLAGADNATVAGLSEAALCIGMAFQIRDDILDVTSTEAELGKPIGSDAAQGKVTWLTLYGMEKSERDILEYTEKACSIIRRTGALPFLEELVYYLAGRKS